MKMISKGLKYPKVFFLFLLISFTLHFHSILHFYVRPITVNINLETNISIPLKNWVNQPLCHNK